MLNLKESLLNKFLWSRFTDFMLKSAVCLNLDFTKCKKKYMN